MSYGNTWEELRGERGREGGWGSSILIPMKGNMLTANKADELVLVLNYLRCG